MWKNEKFTHTLFFAKISWKQRFYSRSYQRVDLTKKYFGESKFFIFPHCERMTTIIIKLTFLLATSFHSIIQTVKKLVLKSGTTSSSFVALESCIENLRGINFYVTFNESSSFFSSVISPREIWLPAWRPAPMLDGLIGTKCSKKSQLKRREKSPYSFVDPLN